MFLVLTEFPERAASSIAAGISWWATLFLRLLARHCRDGCLTPAHQSGAPRSLRVDVQAIACHTQDGAHSGFSNRHQTPGRIGMVPGPDERLAPAPQAFTAERDRYRTASGSGSPEGHRTQH